MDLSHKADLQKRAKYNAIVFVIFILGNNCVYELHRYYCLFMFTCQHYFSARICLVPIKFQYLAKFRQACCIIIVFSQYLSVKITFMYMYYFEKYQSNAQCIWYAGITAYDVISGCQVCIGSGSIVSFNINYIVTNTGLLYIVCKMLMYIHNILLNFSYIE